MRRRQRYLVYGPEGLGPEELLALALGTGTAGRTAEQIGRDLLQRFGSLAGLRESPPGALEKVSGIGAARAVQLHAALHLGRFGAPMQASRVIDGPAAAAALLGPHLRGRTREAVHAAYLDRSGRVRHVRRIIEGTDAFTLVDPRLIYQPAVQLGASRVVIAHNHPSGDPRPSEADFRATRMLVDAATTLCLELVDHLIITEETHTSLAALGAIRAHAPHGGRNPACATLSGFSPSGSPH